MVLKAILCIIVISQFVNDFLPLKLFVKNAQYDHVGKDILWLIASWMLIIFSTNATELYIARLPSGFVADSSIAELTRQVKNDLIRLSDTIGVYFFLCNHFS